MIKIQDILNFSKKLVHVNSSANINEVCTLFKSEDVSYLPIIDGPGKNIGVYKRKNLFKWLISNPERRINNELIKQFKEPPLLEVNFNTNLNDAIRILKYNSALLVKHEGNYNFLISPRSVANFLYKYSSRFIIFEELEKIIRGRIIEKNIDLSTIRSDSINRPLPKDPNFLDFGQYRTVLSTKWVELEYNYDLKTIMKLLNKSLEYRNALMHFRTDDKFLDENMKSAQKLVKLLS